MTKFRNSSQSTKTSLRERANNTSRSLIAKRSDRLVRPLRRLLQEARRQDPDTPINHQFGYGLIEMETDRVFRQITDDGFLHQIHVISGDRIDGILSYIVEAQSTTAVFPGAYFPGGAGRFPGNIDDGGEVDVPGTIFSGRFSGVFPTNRPPNGSQIRLYAGTQQAADPDLVAQTDVDDRFIGRGVSYVWSKFAFQEGRFNGDPSLKVYARSRRVVDPRTFAGTFDASPKTFAFNPYRFVFDYLTRPRLRGGLGVEPDLIDIASFQDSATWADGLVDTQQTSHVAVLTTRTNQNTGTPPINTNHLLEFNQAVCPFEFGDVVNINIVDGQSLPTNLSTNTDYFVVPVRPLIGDFQVTAIALANSLEDALNGVTIPQGTRSSDITVTKVKEVRFQSGVVYRSGDDILESMLESCGAFLYLNNGRIAITSQRFPDAEDIEAVSIDELIGGVALSTSIDADDRATSLSGSFRSLTNLFIPKPYPTVDGGGLFEQEDGRETLLPFNLPLASKGTVAQRLATIELRRRRQELSVGFSGDLSLFRLRPNTIFSLDFPKYGLDSETTFEVVDQVVFLRVTNDVPFLGVNIEGRQLEAGTFDLDTTNAQLVESARIPGIATPFAVEAPTSVQVTEELFQTRLGAGVRARAIISWTASTSLFVTEYEVSLRRTPAAGEEPESFFFLARVPSTDLQTRIDDLQPDFYDFQVTAINSLGLRSQVDTPQITNFQIQGLTSTPSTPTNFRGQVLGAATVFLSWDRSSDLDVREGGFVEIRHSPQITGAVARDSVFLDSDVGGQTSIAVPFLQGTYWLRFEDSTGQFSEPVSWSTQSRRPVGIAFLNAGIGNALDNTNADPNAFTIQEDPTFPSSNPGNTLILVGGDHLELPLESTFDDEADVDAIVDIDQVGGGSVTPEGFYFFSTAIELDTPTRVLVESVLNTEIFDSSTSIDAEEDFDQISDVDEIGGVLLTPGLATAEIEVRFSNGTIASNTFGPWERINTQFIEALSFEFRVVARSTVSTVNIRINEARIRMRVVNL